jgi:dihydroorotase
MTQPRRLYMRRWFERHLHVRDGELLKTVLPCTLAQRPTGAVIMGNLKPPYHTSTIDKAVAYRDRITRLLPEGCDFKPCMTMLSD